MQIRSTDGRGDGVLHSMQRDSPLSHEADTRRACARKLLRINNKIKRTRERRVVVVLHLPESLATETPVT